MIFHATLLQVFPTPNFSNPFGFLERDKSQFIALVVLARQFYMHVLVGMRRYFTAPTFTMHSITG